MFSSLRAALVVSAAFAANLSVTDEIHNAEAALQSSLADVDGRVVSLRGNVVMLGTVGPGRKGVLCLPI